MTTDNLPGRHPGCKIITIVSEKGGSGKTSLAYLLASAAIADGLKVHCIDCDRNPQFLSWRGTCQDAHLDEDVAFPALLTATKMPDDPMTAEAHLSEMTHRADIVLVDTRPGRYADTEDLAYCADVILVPGMPRAGEIKLVGDTVLWMHTCRDAFVDLDSFPPIKVAVLNASVSMARAVSSEDVDALTASDFDLLKRFSQLPYLETVIPNSRIIERFSQDGPLTVQLDRLQGRPTQYVTRILDLARLLLTEVLALTPEYKELYDA